MRLWGGPDRPSPQCKVLVRYGAGVQVVCAGSAVVL